MSNSRRSEPPANVIVFGPVGAGKSSVINLLGPDLQGKNSKPVLVSNSTQAVSPYDRVFGERRTTLYDTPSLREMGGAVKAMDLFVMLMKFDELKTSGIDLLVLVVQIQPDWPSLDTHYKVFHDILCAKQVPVLLVVTGMDNEEEPDNWWNQNQQHFADLELADHVCVTASRGLGRTLEEYDTSKPLLEQAIADSLSPRGPWKPPHGDVWLRNAEMELIREKLMTAAVNGQGANPNSLSRKDNCSCCNIQ